MKRKRCVGVTRASATGVAACLAVLCVPAVGVAAAPADSRADTADRASSVLARGAGYGQPQARASVVALQRRLRALGYRPGPVDGLYGPRTEAAVQRLQRDRGIPVDGIVGAQTRRALRVEAPPLAPGAGYGRPGGSAEVRAVQRRLRALGHRPGPVDGLYGPRTRAAVERFQRTAGLPATGVVSVRATVALAPGDRNRPAAGAGDRRRGQEARHRARGPASPAGASGPDHRPHLADDRSATGQSATSTKRRPAADADRIEETDGSGSPSALPLAVLALALATIGGLFAGWPLVKSLRRRKTRLVVAAEALGTGANGGREPAAGKAGVDGAAKAASLRALNGHERLSAPAGDREPIPRHESGDGSDWPQADDASEVKQRIREMRASGMTLQAIADRLNAENVPTLRGGTKWRPSAVQAATGYRRPGLRAGVAGNGRGPSRNGSPRGRRRRSRQQSSGRTRGGRG
jgi:peptidoglycan hydrolase-like protein with peptidoglycan-binding domain